MLNNIEAGLNVKIARRLNLMTFSCLGRRWRVAPEKRAITSLWVGIDRSSDGDMIVKVELSRLEFSYDQSLIEFKGISKMHSYVLVKG